MNDSLISRQAAIDAMEQAKEQYFDRRVIIGKMQDIVNNLPSAEPRWILCSERLPLKPGFYMVTVGAPYKSVRVYEYNPCEGYENENLWKGEDGAYVFNWFVEAWQNLPEPWEGEDDESVN